MRVIHGAVALCWRSWLRDVRLWCGSRPGNRVRPVRSMVPVVARSDPDTSS